MRALILTLLPAVALAQDCPAGGVWPDPDWDDSQLAAVQQNKAAEIKALEDAFFTLKGKDADREGIRTDGLLIIKDGKLIYEKYARGFTRSNKHISWSVAKSFTSAMVGIAVQQGKMRIDQSICDFLPNMRKEVCRISVQDLLEFASGFDWQEEYEHSSYQTSSVLAFLFGEGHKDMLKFTTDTSFFADPGTAWRYSTGDAMVLSAVVKSAVGSQKGWAQDLIFKPLGMTGAVLEEDLKGTPQGGSSVFATPRDFARLGYLYLHNGCWKDQRLLPAYWVTQSSTASLVYRAHSPAAEDEPNGWMWWLNQAIPEKGQAKPWKDAPDDAYEADGHWGQYIVVVPSANVVIMRTGDDRNESADQSSLISLSLKVAE
jgi:CubicO group peptidase (beta-lactamase class C family)